MQQDNYQRFREESLNFCIFKMFFAPLLKRIFAEMKIARGIEEYFQQLRRHCFCTRENLIRTKRLCVNKQLSTGLFDFLLIDEYFEQGKYLKRLEGQISEKKNSKEETISFTLNVRNFVKKNLQGKKEFFRMK